MESITLQGPKTIQNTIHLAASKSESNRALIIQALTSAPGKLFNLANARDTQTMTRLLDDRENPVWDVIDAGTTMRFLTAFAATQGLQKEMTGTQRMQERPIGVLVDALRSMGAEIDYLKNDGYPPHQTKGFKQVTNEVTVRSDISSQYISALLMMAPTLPDGLTLHLKGKIGSWPYINMTLRIMETFGIQYPLPDDIKTPKEGLTIHIPHQDYTGKDFTIESDWSAASYWYSIVALSEDENASITISGLKDAKDSTQGDAVMGYHPQEGQGGFMQHLGVTTHFDPKTNLTTLTKGAHKDYFEWDFTHCPDIAQTVAVICAAKGISARLTGLESLRIKETDRIDAIKTELNKYGVEVGIQGDEAITLDQPQFKAKEHILINTYKDHRMAMAFAPLASLTPLKIENPGVVDKSYPDFWQDLESTGFLVTA